jgi:hypothetical protein
MELEPIRHLTPDQRPRRIPADRRDDGARRRFEEAWRRERQGAAEPETPVPADPPARPQLQSDRSPIRRGSDGGLHVDVLA